MKTLSLLLFFFSAFALSAQSWFRSNQDADLMVSGAGFNQTGGALQFNHPNGLASDGQNLLLCDRFNNRVLFWSKAPNTWDALPDLVLGQTDFNSNKQGSSKSEMNWPSNVSVAQNGKLAVADTENDRLLLWQQFPQNNGQAADVSIELPKISPPGTPLIWGWPWGIWTDGTRLAAVATQGGTILFWNTFPVKDNQAPDYTINNSNFGTPRNISSDGQTYFIVGDHNAKVTGMPGTFFWNSYPNLTNQPYDFYRDEWIKGQKLQNGQFIASGIRSIYTWDKVPTASGQNPIASISPSYYDNGDGVDVVEADGKIYVCNYNGNNILVYPKAPDSSAPNPLFALGAADYTYNTLKNIGYIQNPAFASDGQNLIISSDYDQKIYLYHSWPTYSGQKADQEISTRAYNLAAWDIAWYNGYLVAAGKNSVCIWNPGADWAQRPNTLYNRSLGSAQFDDLKGVALDASFFYLADRNGKVYIWEGLPANASANPRFTLNLGNVQLNRLSSDGTYLCVTQQAPAAVYIYRIADLKTGVTTPWKSISGIGLLNLPAEAITFNGSLAIANQSFHNVLLWKNINDAPSTSNMIVLGQTNNQADNPPGITANRMFMPGALLYENEHLWVGEFKFSSRILRFSAQMTTPTQDLDQVSSWKIYPNPGSGEFWLETVLSDSKDLEIFDQYGRLILKTTIHSSQTRLDLKNFAAGLYWVRYNKESKRIFNY